MKRAVLDASALMAYFERRPGAEKVKDLLGEAIEGKKSLFMCVVNWGEVYYSIWRVRGREAADKALEYVSQLPIEIVDADRELTLQAAALRAEHKLPYADCFAAALAKLRRASVVTSDADFSTVSGEVELLKV